VYNVGSADSVETA